MRVKSTAKATDRRNIRPADREVRGSELDGVRSCGRRKGEVCEGSEGKQVAVGLLWVVAGCGREL